MLRRALLIAACLALVAPEVHAQAGTRFLDGVTLLPQNILGTLTGGISPTNVARVPRTDETGNLTIVDVTPKALVETPVFGNLSFGVGDQDSSAVIDTEGFDKMGVWIRGVCTGVGAAGSCDSARYAICAFSARVHSTSSNDSITAHPFGRFKPATISAAVSGFAVDTVGTITADPPDSTLMAVKRWRRFADPNTEIVVIIPLNPDKQHAPWGQTIPVADPRTGIWYGGPKMSFRLRYLRTIDQSNNEIPEGAGAIPALPFKLTGTLVRWR